MGFFCITVCFGSYILITKFFVSSSLQFFTQGKCLTYLALALELCSDPNSAMEPIWDSVSSSVKWSQQKFHRRACWETSSRHTACALWTGYTNSFFPSFLRPQGAVRRWPTECGSMWKVRGWPRMGLPAATPPSPPRRSGLGCPLSMPQAGSLSPTCLWPAWVRGCELPLSSTLERQDGSSWVGS